MAIFFVDITISVLTHRNAIVNGNVESLCDTVNQHFKEIIQKVGSLPELVVRTSTWRWPDGF